jgi:tetratricopeptide (TPR) repeat protein
MHEPERAIAHLRKATVLNPNYALAHFTLGSVLREKRDMQGAIAELRRADELNRDVSTLSMLGLLLQKNMELDEAIALFREGVKLAPRMVKIRCNLVTALLTQNRFAEAHEAIVPCLSLRKNHPESRRVLELFGWAVKGLDSELADFLKGGRRSQKGQDLLQLAKYCQYAKRYYSTAARLYHAAFEAQDTLTQDLKKGRRYDAACCALRAAAGEGQDPQLPVDGLPRKLRDHALAWLQADLALSKIAFQSDKVGSVVLLQKMLPHWQKDPDLASVRDAENLASLPIAEQKPWMQLWADVDQLHKQVRGIFTETTREGILTEQQPQQTHAVKMVVGKTYVIDMHSTDLNCYLELRDKNGTLLHKNDDLDENYQDARLIFTPTADGTFKIVSTSFEQHDFEAHAVIPRFLYEQLRPRQNFGAYTLTIRVLDSTRK